MSESTAIVSQTIPPWTQERDDATNSEVNSNSAEIHETSTPVNRGDRKGHSRGRRRRGSGAPTQTEKQVKGQGRKGSGRGATAGNAMAISALDKTKSSRDKTALAETEFRVEQGTRTVDAGIDTSDPTTSMGDGSSDTCWICAEPVRYYSVPECNHRTCHVCALRLRALYKKNDCTFCKEPQTCVIFTSSVDAQFTLFNRETMEYKDNKLSIYFETPEMMEETLVLLRFSCPDAHCDYIGKGWGDLKLHVRATHGKLMCDLCIRSKKVFAHEHTLYSPSHLPIHLPSIHQRSYHYNPPPKDHIEGGIHPLCEFCRECFFGDDELYAHMRERHEECFVCKRNGMRDQYFQDYEQLEHHFHSAHHPCTQPQCLAQKFVVFNSTLDLKAHMVEEHGGEMSARDRKDARRIQTEITFEDPARRERERRRDRDRSVREREREPPPLPSQQITRRPGPGRRREGFGTNLTIEGSGSVTPRNGGRAEGHHQPSPSPPLADVDPVTAQRHAALISRLQALAANPTNAVSAVKASMRGYRASESSAQDLILTIWNVLDRNLEHTASMVNGFVDLLEEEDKKQDVLSSWKGFEIEQRREFPELVPTTTGSGYASIASGRVLNAKHSTSTRSSQQSSRQVWARVALAASSSSAYQPSPPGARLPTIERTSFPALSATAGSNSNSTPPMQPFRQPQRTTPWSASAGFRPAAATLSAVSLPSPSPSPVSSSIHTSVTTIPRPALSNGQHKHHAPPPTLSDSLFPELPSCAGMRSKAAVSGNVSLKNILGGDPPPVNKWQAGGTRFGHGAGGTDTHTSASTGESVTSGADGVDADGDMSAGAGGGKGKKGKGKQKQTLFTIGSLPA